MEPFIFSYMEPDHPHHYEMRRTEESALLGGKSENSVQVFFSLHYSGKSDQAGNKHFEYKASKRKQTNNKGLYGWSDDLGILTENLLLGVSPETGRIDCIYNSDDIYNK